jgi:hypothetical protein
MGVLAVEWQPRLKTVEIGDGLRADRVGHIVDRLDECDEQKQTMLAHWIHGQEAG